MADRRIRDLERRAAAAGSIEAQGRLRRERSRAAQVEREVSEIARLVSEPRRLAGQAIDAAPAIARALRKLLRAVTVSGVACVHGVLASDVAHCKALRASRGPGGKVVVEHLRPVRHSILFLCVRTDDEVRFGIGRTKAQRPTPGTVWPELSPWRSRPGPGLREKLRAWAPHEGIVVSAAAASAWVESRT